MMSMIDDVVSVSDTAIREASDANTVQRGCGKGATQRVAALDNTITARDSRRN